MITVFDLPIPAAFSLSPTIILFLSSQARVKRAQTVTDLHCLAVDYHAGTPRLPSYRPKSPLGRWRTHSMWHDLMNWVINPHCRVSLFGQYRYTVQKHDSFLWQWFFLIISYHRVINTWLTWGTSDRFMSVNKIAQELIMVVNHGSTRRIGAQHKYCATEKLDRRKKKEETDFLLFVCFTYKSKSNGILENWNQNNFVWDTFINSSTKQRTRKRDLHRVLRAFMLTNERNKYRDQRHLQYPHNRLKFENFWKRPNLPYLTTESNTNIFKNDENTIWPSTRPKCNLEVFPN